jgi:hypothetical protein
VEFVEELGDNESSGKRQQLAPQGRSDPERLDERKDGRPPV